MKLDHSLPIIDWQLALKLTANKEDLAQEMLAILIATLPDDVATLKKLHSQQDIKTLISQTHKLHSGLCYCGLPRLKSIVAQLEIELKNNIFTNAPTLLSQLDGEVSLLLDYYANKVTLN